MLPCLPLFGASLEARSDTIKGVVSRRNIRVVDTVASFRLGGWISR